MFVLFFNSSNFLFFKVASNRFRRTYGIGSYMHRDLVEKRKWITEEDYQEGLALAQLAPGPLAAQLTIYIGHIDYKSSAPPLQDLPLFCHLF